MDGRGRSQTGDVSDRLDDLAHRVDRLSPSRCQPERFFEERDEISAELRRLAQGG